MLYERWVSLAKQPDVEGSSRGLALSLLCDHCKSEAFLECFRRILAADDPAGQVAQLAGTLKALFPLAPSSKHMSGRGLG